MPSSQILYSNIQPVRINHPRATFQKVFNESVAKSDRIDIAVGYVSQASLEALRELVSAGDIRKINLILGMYVVDGITARTLHLARTINTEWKRAGVGSIRAVKCFKYHGKTYAFRRGGTVSHVIIGSANLSAIRPDAQTKRQYEISTVTTDPEICREVADFIEKLKDSKYSADIDDIHFKTLLDDNLELEGDENALRMPSQDFKLYKRYAIGTEFLLPLKVPTEAEKYNDSLRKFTKSNINVCYAAPRSAGKPRDWYEIQFTVPREVRELPGYPKRGEPFFVLTDDSYLFKVHTTSDNNKQFSAVGDELTLGRWLKGRFVSAGLVKPALNTQEDSAGARDGMITQEMLDQYGCTSLALQRTNRTYPDDKDEGRELELWLLSFKMKEGFEGADAVESEGCNHELS